MSATREPKTSKVLLCGAKEKESGCFVNVSTHGFPSSTIVPMVSDCDAHADLNKSPRIATCPLVSHACHTAKNLM